MKKENKTQLPPCLLTSAWRYSNGFLMCGTLRIFRADFDTDPSPEFKDELTSWMAATLNASAASRTVKRSPTVGMCKRRRLRLFTPSSSLQALWN